MKHDILKLMILIFIFLNIFTLGTSGDFSKIDNLIIGSSPEGILIIDVSDINKRLCQENAVKIPCIPL